MKTRERMETYVHSFTPETPFCENCTHYSPHYTECGFKLNSGHCVYPRIKLKKAYDTCEHFQTKSEGDK